MEYIYIYYGHWMQSCLDINLHIKFVTHNLMRIFQRSNVTSQDKNWSIGQNYFIICYKIASIIYKFTMCHVIFSQVCARLQYISIVQNEANIVICYYFTLNGSFPRRLYPLLYGYHVWCKFGNLPNVDISNLT